MNPHKHRRPGEPITAAHIKYGEEVMARYWRRREYRFMKPVIDKVLKLVRDEAP